MTTRAIQIECLLTPIYDYRDNSLAVGYTVRFYEAGTSTPKNVWTEKEKTNPYTTRTLGSDGTVQVYGEGVYKITIEDADTTVIHSWDHIKIEAVNYSVVTKTSTYTATPDDDVILVDTGAGDVTINLGAIATFTHPLTIKNIGANSVIIDGNGAETIDGSLTVSFSALNYAATLYPGPSEWKLGQVASKVVDADGDTYWDAEESADEDKLHAYVGVVNVATKQLTIEDGAIFPAVDDDIDLGKATTNEFKDAHIDGIAYIDQANIDSYQITGAYNALMPTNGVGANAVFMLGNASTIAWFYLNTAPPGWKVLATGADGVLAVAGGTASYNVLGGNPDSVATWTIAGLTKDAHTHPETDHSHQIYNSTGAVSSDDQYYNNLGNLTDFDNGLGKNATYYGAAIGGNGSTNVWPADAYTADSGSTSTGAQSDAGITSDATWRPKASVGKLFQLDTA